MRIFLDTEFTDFVDTQLISIGLVAESGQQFYAELNDFDLARCSRFVVDAVLPQLYKNPAQLMSTFQVRECLMNWLAQFSSQNPVICYDFYGDLELFQNLMTGATPSWLSHLNVYPWIDQVVLEQFFEDLGLSRHHALNDAIANRFAYRPDA
jgi:hypothetical protein